MDNEFANDALILIAHGSTVNAQSSASARALAETIRDQSIFSEVVCAFKLEEPRIEGVPNLVNSQRVFVVPVTISEGQFTEEIIPFDLGLCAKSESNYSRKSKVRGKELIYCKPVGTHSSMTDVIVAKAVDIVGRHPFPHEPRPSETTLIVVGHGTRQNANSRKAIEDQVELIRARDEYSEVFAAFMEEPPLISDCYELTKARYIVIVPFFISDGLHTVEDIPVLLGEPADRVKERMESNQPTWRNPTERKGKLVWYAKAIGEEPHLPEVVIDRVREAIR
tara:strand:+ start:1594 stop:2433 length:840 start_codon:yes stop_codon:yes gene_type:complete